MGANLNPSWDTESMCAAALLGSSGPTNSTVKYFSPFCASCAQNYATQVCSALRPRLVISGPAATGWSLVVGQKLQRFVTAVRLGRNTAASHQTFLCKGWDLVQPALSQAYFKKWEGWKGKITAFLIPGFWWQPVPHEQDTRAESTHWPWLLALIAKTQSAPTLHPVQPTLARTLS